MIVGETYTDLMTVQDSSGVPGNATVTATVTLPDGSTAAPTIGNPQVGKYPIDFLTSQAGRHTLLISATSGVLGTIVRKATRVFYVDPTAITSLVSLADGKAFLNIPSDRLQNDAEVAHFLAVASEFVEARTEQSWQPRTLTERHMIPRWRENVIILRDGPVNAVTSVTEAGYVLTSSYWSLNQVGNYLLRTSGWWSGPVDITYTVGSAVMPLRVRHAVLLVLKHLWSTQRGPGTPNRQGADDVYDPRSSYSFPRAVAEMLTDLGGSASLYVG